MVWIRLDEEESSSCSLVKVCNDAAGAALSCCMLFTQYTQ